MRFITGAIVLMTAATSIATDTDLLDQDFPGLNPVSGDMRTAT